MSPFKSENQRRLLWSKHPDIARKWTNKYGSIPEVKTQPVGTPQKLNETMTRGRAQIKTARQQIRTQSAEGRKRVATGRARVATARTQIQQRVGVGQQKIAEVRKRIANKRRWLSTTGGKMLVK